MWETFLNICKRLRDIWKSFRDMWKGFRDSWKSFRGMWKRLRDSWKRLRDMWKGFRHLWERLCDIWQRPVYREESLFGSRKTPPGSRASHFTTSFFLVTKLGTWLRILPGKLSLSPLPTASSSVPFRGGWWRVFIAAIRSEAKAASPGHEAQLPR